MQHHKARHRLSFLAVFLLGIAMCACAGAPVQEMSNARQAIAAAEQAGAAARAPSELRQARRWMTRAEEALQIGEYSRARQNADRARRLAIEALDVAQGRQSDADHNPP